MMYEKCFPLTINLQAKSTLKCTLRMKFIVNDLPVHEGYRSGVCRGYYYHSNVWVKTPGIVLASSCPNALWVIQMIVVSHCGSHAKKFRRK